METLKNEPVAIWPALGLLIGQLLRQLVPDLGDDLIAAVIDFVIAWGPVIVGLWYARSQAYGPVTVQKMKDA